MFFLNILSISSFDSPITFPYNNVLLKQLTVEQFCELFDIEFPYNNVLLKRHKSYINNDLCFVDCFESKPNYCESLNSSMIEAYEKFGNIAIIVGSQHMTHLIECCKRYKIDYKIFA